LFSVGAERAGHLIFGANLSVSVYATVWTFGNIAEHIKLLPCSSAHSFIAPSIWRRLLMQPLQQRVACVLINDGIPTLKKTTDNPELSREKIKPLFEIGEFRRATKNKPKPARQQLASANGQSNRNFKTTTTKALSRNASSTQNVPRIALIAFIWL
jgi:hypothetical protein